MLTLFQSLNSKPNKAQNLIKIPVKTTEGLLADSLACMGDLPRFETILNNNIESTESNVLITIEANLTYGQECLGVTSIMILHKNSNVQNLSKPMRPTDEGEFSYDSKVVFTWEPVENAVNYQLQVSTDENMENVVFDKKVGKVISKEVSGLEIGLKYYARIKAIGNNGQESDWSDSSDGITILYEQDGNVTIAKNVIYPENGDEVSFVYKLDKSQKVSIEIYNINGDLVKVLIDKETRIPGEYTEKWDGKSISGYVVASGLYLVKIKIGGQTEVKKVLVIK